MNPSGDTVILGNYNRFYIYNYNKRRSTWEEVNIDIELLYIIKSILLDRSQANWKLLYSDSIVLEIRRIQVMHRFTLWVSRHLRYFDEKNQIQGKIRIQLCFPILNYSKKPFKWFKVHWLFLNSVIFFLTRFVIKTEYSPEITRINVLQDRFVVANTLDSIVIGDLLTEKISEV